MFSVFNMLPDNNHGGSNKVFFSNLTDVVLYGLNESTVYSDMALNTPFPEFKMTGDDKHDLETYIEDLTDYCIMQNWFDTSKETDAQKWTKPDKVKDLTSIKETQLLKLF